MSRELRAAILYVLLAFAMGFVLGPVRELLLAPAIGRIGALLVELPVLLGVCWWLVPRVMGGAKEGVGGGVARLRVGFAALALLLVLEFTVGVAVRGWDLPAWLADFWTPHGAVTLAGYWVFALIPYWRGVRAVDWEPFEISVVPVPVDATAVEPALPDPAKGQRQP